MQANELRIGSLVYRIHRGGKVHLPIEKPLVVIGIGLTMATVCSAEKPFHSLTKDYYQEVRLSDLSEIPLTEEWLIKFGFKKEDSEWKLFPCFEIQIIVFNEDSYNGVMFYTRTIHVDYTPIYSGRHITYVHQLQNLYFSLVGDELATNH